MTLSYQRIRKALKDRDQPLDRSTLLYAHGWFQQVQVLLATWPANGIVATGPSVFKPNDKSDEFHRFMAVLEKTHKEQFEIQWVWVYMIEFIRK